MLSLTAAQVCLCLLSICAQSHSCSSLCGAVVRMCSVLRLLKSVEAVVYLCCVTAAQVCGTAVHLLSVLELLKSVQAVVCLCSVLELLKSVQGSCPTVISLIAAKVCLGQLSICAVLQLLRSV